MRIITQTPRLIIREFAPEEQDTYLQHFTNEEVCLYIPKRSTEERIKIFQTAIAGYADSKLMGIWGMFSKDTGEFIGSCLLRPHNDNPRILEIGYSIDKVFWGQGISTEMAKALVEYAFTYPFIEEVVAVTVIENIASQRVLENAGLKRVENIFHDGLELAHFRRSR